MAFYISARCPECGAPARHPEGALTFKCPFCASVLRVKDEGTFLKYIIPARVSPAEAPLAVKRAMQAGKVGGLRTVRRIITFHKPFWYCKGMLFFAFADERMDVSSAPLTTDENNPPPQHAFTNAIRAAARAADVIAKTWSHTFAANPALAVPLRTLGIQAEVLTLEPYDSEQYKETLVAPITLDRAAAEKMAMDAALNNMNMDRKRYSYSSLNFIGEKYFIIYYPVLAAICEGDGGFITVLLDGINKNFIAATPGKEIIDETGAWEHAAARFSIITHRCPNCGHDLEPGGFDIVFYCRSCFSLWLLEGGDYRRLPKKALKSTLAQGTVYIPFWRFTLELDNSVSGERFSTVGELAKLVKGGDLYLRGIPPENPIVFHLPALTTSNATAALKLAARICGAQKEMPFDDVEEFPHATFQGASLPLDEARQMLPVVAFSVIGRTDRKTVDFYNSMTVRDTSADLVWYPFEEKGTMLIDQFLGFNISKRGMSAEVY
ncbi:MAG: zf-TFIIB domain-containing protein [Nitrospinae bacterium]|nr:zf-TFIIB domain-containing protein [Nitrospinota bacterium]